MDISGSFFFFLLRGEIDLRLNFDAFNIFIRAR